MNEPSTFQVQGKQVQISRFLQQSESQSNFKFLNKEASVFLVYVFRMHPGESNLQQRGRKIITASWRKTPVSPRTGEVGMEEKTEGFVSIVAANCGDFKIGFIE